MADIHLTPSPPLLNRERSVFGSKRIPVGEALKHFFDAGGAAPEEGFAAIFVLIYVVIQAIFDGVNCLIEILFVGTGVKFLAVNFNQAVRVKNLSRFMAIGGFAHFKIYHYPSSSPFNGGK
jgi:hypothetical protein